MLLFSAAYASVQSVVTSVILDRSAPFTYHFVVLCFYSLNSLSSTFPTFSDLRHYGSSFEVPSTLNNKVGKQAWCVVHTRNHLVCTNKCMDIRRKKHITTCKEWMPLLQLKRCYNNIISCLNLYSSCIKKMINPDGIREEFSAVIYMTRCNVRPSEHQICWFLEPLLGFSPINLNPFTFPYISFEIQIL